MLSFFLCFRASFYDKSFVRSFIEGKCRERERVEYARQSSTSQRIQKRLHMKLSVKVNNGVVCVSFLVLLKMTYTTHLS